MSTYGSGLPGLSVRRPYLAAVLNLLIIIAGLGALMAVEVRELPNIDRPIVSVRAEYPGGSPETIDAEVTSVLERAVARVNGVKAVRSSSEENNMRMRVEFSPSANLIDAANDVREAVSRAERDLPDEVENITVIKADNDAEPILRLAVTSSALPVEDVTRVVEDQIVPELLAVDGVADAQLFGERERVLRVVVDPNRLASYGLSIRDVSDLMARARYDVPAGSFESAQQEVLVRANASVVEPSEIRDLRLRDNVRLGQVADVYFGPADESSRVRLDGRTVVSVGVIRQAKSNTVEIAEGVRGAVDSLNTRLTNVDIAIQSDDSVFIEGAISEVLTSLALATLIVVAVIWLFFGRFRATIVPAVVIPVALIGAVAALWLFGFSINLITLLALVLATGLVVDDAIVVLENIQRRQAQGIGAKAAAVIGTQQVFFAVLATTATLVAVFVPISFLPSTAGRLFREFGFMLAATVLISSFVALTLCPMIASRLPLAQEGGGSRFSLGGLGELLQRAYDKLLSIVLAAPLIVLAAACGVGAVALVIFHTLGEELVPQEDRGEINVWLQAPDGVGLDYMDLQVEKAEGVFDPLIEEGTVERLFSITGRYDFNRGYLSAPLAPWEQRARAQQEIEATIRGPLNDIPGFTTYISRGNSLGLRGPGGGGLELALTGSNYPAIAAAADDFARKLETEIPGLSNTRVQYQATQPQISLRIDRERAANLNVDIDDLASTIRVLVDGFEVAELTVDDQAVPIILQSAAGSVSSPADLGNLYVRSQDDRLIPLIQMISFSQEGVAAELDRHAQRRAIEIDADLSPSLPLRDAVEQTRALAQAELPTGIGLLFLGEAQTLEETSREIAITFAIALLVVFLVLIAQFESVTSAAVIMITVPFGMAAAVFALYLTGTTINIYSQIGVLVLVGIMAKNGILLVEFADQLRDRGASVVEAAREAASVRLRPITMTMISTIFAGLPLILSAGPGSESRTAIGWVIFGGLGLAAVFTLFLTPAVYTLVARLSKPRASASEELAKQMRESERLL
ncbi:efflux RND transporter permease subunit [Dichotomicrobium thermohalophilum]|uniref:Hydrophobe/amphiphile efflux-1 (HAE1) family protein n=1 Tax=Dichotomicrobium thermohalophilum TaxID=933063 RepID=A0A397Q7F1_9HYPH|nr:efflux RND transporter permease subunit [Dichotomicrobium thermohalophilum]RIA55735.1 hydrophobe/amphiphile efflux-1 (HAE1) family protein [Dichotomicrobium thermohalophilum]